MTKKLINANGGEYSRGVALTPERTMEVAKEFRKLLLKQQAVTSRLLGERTKLSSSKAQEIISTINRSAAPEVLAQHMASEQAAEKFFQRVFPERPKPKSTAARKRKQRERERACTKGPDSLYSSANDPAGLYNHPYGLYGSANGPESSNGDAKGPDVLHRVGSYGDANGPDGNAKQYTAVAAPAAPSAAAGAVGGPSPPGAVAVLAGSDRTSGQRDPDVVQGRSSPNLPTTKGGDAAAADSAPIYSETSGREAGAAGRPYDQILLILDRAGREKARIEAESRREVRAGIEALESALEGRESRVADGKRRRLEAADADASRKIRAVLRAGTWAAEPRASSLSDRP
jgi:hypothetical protein